MSFSFLLWCTNVIANNLYEQWFRGTVVSYRMYAEDSCVSQDTMVIAWCLLFIVVSQLAFCHAERTKKSYYRYPSGNIVERLYNVCYYYGRRME